MGEERALITAIFHHKCLRFALGGGGLLIVFHTRAAARSSLQIEREYAAINLHFVSALHLSHTMQLSSSSY